ncbi:hypothetical protein ACP70R_032811 [Stipagrostis hirtigluma subsp. patula]
MASKDPKVSQEIHKSEASPELHLRKYLLLLATLVATVTYAVGLNVPGGLWQETQDGHIASDPILRDTHYRRYVTFYYCNAAAFAASLVVCLLLLLLDETSKLVLPALRVVMVLDLFGLMGAYAAGSCRDAFTSIYSSVLVFAVLVYVAFVFFSYVYGLKDGDKQVNDPQTQVEKPIHQEDPNKKQVNDPQNQAEEPTSHGNDDIEKQDTKKQAEDLKKEGDEREDPREVLLLLTTFAITITYVAGLNPPGGFWSSSEDGHHVSDPILQDHHPTRYQAFFVCNTTTFVASLFITVLLLDKKLSTGWRSARFVALFVFIVIALFGLVGAYTAGSSREHDNTIYVASLAAAVLVYIFLLVAITMYKKKKEEEKKKEDEKKKNEISLNVPKIPSGGFKKVFSTMKHTVSFVKKLKIKTEQSGTEGDKTSGTDEGNKAKDNATLNTHNLVMLLATLVVSITYQAGLDPPGGLWPDDRDGHKLGDPVLLTTHPTRYKVFFYSNSAAFVASLIVIIMVQSKFLLKRHTLEAAMILDLFGLISAYAAGSCRDLSTSIYVVALAGAVLIYVVIHIIIFTLDNKKSIPDDEKMENKREMLLLLAILAATLTYQAGLTPPGGFWSANDSLRHKAGFPVLLDNYPRRYKAFFYCNAASFMASVALILLLVNPNLYKPGIQCYALYVCMVGGMFGLMGAYAAGSARHLRASIFTITLAAAVLAFVALLMIIFWIIPYILRKIPKEKECGIVKYLKKKFLKDEQRGGNPEDGSPKQATTDSEEKDQAEGVVSNLKPLKKKDSEEKEMREYLMLLGVLAASVTYQSGLEPPGGLWQDNKNGHFAGDSILHDINKRRYLAFLYSNSTSFMASIIVIVMLLPRKLHNMHLPLWPMHTAILLDMLGLLGAYAAGSARDWKTSRNVILLVVPVLLYIALYAVVFIWSNKGKLCKNLPPSVKSVVENSSRHARG